MTATRPALRRLFDTEKEVPQQLRALWALHVVGGADPAWLTSLLEHGSEHVRCWAVRLLTDGVVNRNTIVRLVELAGRESSWLVRMALASAVGRVEASPRLGLAHALAAMATLADARPAWLVDDLLPMIPTPPLAESVIRILAGSGDGRIAPALLTAYPGLDGTGRAAAIDALSARADTALLLLEAVADKRIPRGDVSLMHVRQINQLGDRALAAKLDAVWGSVQTSPAGAKAAIRRLRIALTPAVLGAANLAAGAAQFEQRCAACHRLFGRGNTIGPDLTGSGRKDLDYLLTNIVDPNAVVPADYRLSIVTTADGRVFSGTMTGETPSAISLRSLTEQLTIDRAQVKDVQRMVVSLMPTGLLEALATDEIRDLVGYLMSDGLVAEKRP